MFLEVLGDFFLGFFVDGDFGEVGRSLVRVEFGEDFVAYNIESRVKTDHVRDGPHDLHSVVGRGVVTRGNHDTRAIVEHARGVEHIGRTKREGNGLDSAVTKTLVGRAVEFGAGETGIVHEGDGPLPFQSRLRELTRDPVRHGGVESRVRAAHVVLLKEFRD